eukprot:IDg7928t1
MYRVELGVFTNRRMNGIVRL